MILKKTHKKAINNLNYYNHLLKIGSYGLKITSNLWLTEKQITSIEHNLKTQLKKLSVQAKKPKLWTNIQLNKTLTKLSLESRMGKGKGQVYTRASFLKKGSIIYELTNINNQQIKEVYALLKKHISVGLKLIYKK